LESLGEIGFFGEAKIHRAASMRAFPEAPRGVEMGLCPEKENQQIKITGVS
jgi:hypothetical protein